MTSLQVQLYTAVSGNDFPRVRELIELGADINAQDDDECSDTGITALLCAKNCEMAKELILHGADVNGCDYYKTTPLMHAACNGNLNLVRLFLSFSADVNALDSYHRNALMQTDDENVFKELINAGTNLNIINSYGDTILTHTARTDRVSLMRYLINQSSLVCVSCNINLILQTPSISTLPSQGLTFTALSRAVQYGSLEMIKEIIRAGADVNFIDSGGWNLIDIANGRKRYNIQFQPPRDSDEIIAYITSILTNDPDTIIDETLGLTNLMVVAKGLPLRTDDILDQRFSLAKSGDSLDFLTVYCKKTKNINTINKSGNTALHYASSLPAVKILLQSGAEPFVTNNKGKTPLACRYLERSDSEVIQCLQRAICARLSKAVVYHRENIFPLLPGVITPSQPEMWQQPEIKVLLPPDYLLECYRNPDSYSTAVQLGMERDINGLPKDQIRAKIIKQLQLIELQSRHIY